MKNRRRSADPVEFRGDAGVASERKTNFGNPICSASAAGWATATVENSGQFSSRLVIQPKPHTRRETHMHRITEKYIHAGRLKS